MRVLSAFFLVALLSPFFSGCFKDSCSRKMSYIEVNPIYLSPEEIHASTLEVEAPRSMENPGRIYYYGDLLFVNELKKGIHIIDNSNPYFPVQEAFLKLPGNENMAVYNGLLYANIYTDLLIIDLNTLQVVGRQENAFRPFGMNQEDGKLLVGFTETPVTKYVDCYDEERLVWLSDGRPVMFTESIDMDAQGAYFFSAGSEVAASSLGNSGGTGIGGSMARYAVVADYLYVIDKWNLNVFSLEQPLQPEKVYDVYVGSNIETIFPAGKFLFIGSESGMYVYSNEDPAAPSLISGFAHARACDPVYVEGTLAYITLRDGNTCEGYSNQLDVVDVSDIFNPKLLHSFPMGNPHGLAVKGPDLFLCDGKYGFKRFDASEVRDGELPLLTEKDINAFDVIALSPEFSLVLVIGADGFYQYSYAEGDELNLVSYLPVKIQ